MQPVANTLKAMKSPEDLQKGLPLGSMTTALTTKLEPRGLPLTEKQHTEIAFSLLQRPFTITSEKKKVYGRKKITDETGNEYTDENAVISERDTFDIAIFLKADISPKWFEAALRNSPRSATIQHLTHLMLHKRLGSNENDRTVLLNDYVKALGEFSEFVVYSVCKCFIENNHSDWYPKIAAIKDLCVLTQETLTRSYNSLQLGHSAKPTFVKRLSEEESPDGKSRRRELCDFIVSKGGDDPYAQRDSNYQLEGTARSKYGWKGYAADRQGDK